MAIDTDDGTRAWGFAVARYTGASDKLGLFHIEGDRMRSADDYPGVVSKWGHCNRERLLSPVFPTLAEARAFKEGNQNGN